MENTFCHVVFNDMFEDYDSMSDFEFIDLHESLKPLSPFGLKLNKHIHHPEFNSMKHVHDANTVIRYRLKLKRKH